MIRKILDLSRAYGRYYADYLKQLSKTIVQDTVRLGAISANIALNAMNVSGKARLYEDISGVPQNFRFAQHPIMWLNESVQKAEEYARIRDVTDFFNKNKVLITPDEVARVSNLSPQQQQAYVQSWVAIAKLLNPRSPIDTARKGLEMML